VIFRIPAETIAPPCPSVIHLVNDDFNIRRPTRLVNGVYDIPPPPLFDEQLSNKVLATVTLFPLSTLNAPPNPEALFEFEMLLEFTDAFAPLKRQTDPPSRSELLSEISESDNFRIPPPST
jgi:hypothetical protein